MVDLLTWNAIIVAGRFAGRFAYLAIVAFSEQCEAKLVHVVLLLYLVVSSALER